MRRRVGRRGAGPALRRCWRNMIGSDFRESNRQRVSACRSYVLRISVMAAMLQLLPASIPGQAGICRAASPHPSICGDRWANRRFTGGQPAERRAPCRLDTSVVHARPSYRNSCARTGIFACSQTVVTMRKMAANDDWAGIEAPAAIDPWSRSCEFTIDSRALQSIERKST